MYLSEDKADKITTDELMHMAFRAACVRVINAVTSNSSNSDVALIVGLKDLYK